jgi:hypothetical protein
MNPPAEPEVIIWLRQALTKGPVESSRIKVMAADAGFSPKTVRRARERLGVVATRHGRRAATRSIWALPAHAKTEPARGGEGSPHPAQLCTEGNAPSDKPAICASTESVKTQVVPSQTGPPGAQVAPSTRALLLSNVDVHDFSGPERARVAQRLSRFVDLGMDATLARAVAIRLVLERDRAGDKGGSCIECQCFDLGSCAPGRDGHTPGPRDPTEIWMCWCARRA